MKDLWIGLDIGGTKCAVILAEAAGGIRILRREQFPTEAERGFEPAYEKLCARIEEMFRAAKGLGSIRCIGISCGGPLDAGRGIILDPPNLPGWRDIPIVQRLEARFSVPAFLQNDANACALVEWRIGAGRGSKDMVFLTMGTGMGAGIISSGQLVCGFHDLAGEVGHMRLAPEGPEGYGKAGSFEGFASGGGMDRVARETTLRLMAQGQPPRWVTDGYAPEEADVALTAAYARKGDALALSLFEDAGRRLGEGIALIADMINPQKVVIGSVFTRCEDLLRPAMEAAMRREALPEVLEGLEVLPARTAERIGDYAAVMVGMNALGVDPMASGEEADPRALAHYERLFERYPALEGCREAVMTAYRMLEKCFRSGGKLLLVGNGGSCADCEHIAGELMKGFYLKRPLPADVKARLRAETDALLPGAAERFQGGLPAIALTGHPALTTAVQNDLDPLMGPAQQVVALGRPGDVVLGISTSGNARNVALAVKTARALGLATLGLAGGDGGRLREICDAAVVVPGSSPADVQELHLPVYHALCAMIEATFFDQ